jgi:endoplasmic reticulum chaperone BiP
LGPAPFLLGSAAAIHLGNTTSCIAAYDFRLGSPEYYQLCMPSWVAITDNDTVLSVEAAMNHATVSPGTTISGFTCLLNQKLKDDVVKSEMKLSSPYKFSKKAGRVAIQFNHPSWRGQVIEFSHVDLAVVLVSELKHRAEAHLGRELSAAVIVVPRHLNYNGRQDIVNAGRYDAGFHRAAKAIDRQIAAAAAYHHHTEQGDRKAILVLRVGGRTSDTTIFESRLEGGVDRRILKFINLITHYKRGLALELKSSPREREGENKSNGNQTNEHGDLFYRGSVLKNLVPVEVVTTHSLSQTVT